MYSHFWSLLQMSPKEVIIDIQNNLQTASAVIPPEPGTRAPLSGNVLFPLYECCHMQDGQGKGKSKLCKVFPKF